MKTTTATMKRLVRDDRGSTEIPAALAGLVISSLVIAALGTFYTDATAAAMENTAKVDSRTASLRATNFIAKDVSEGQWLLIRLFRDPRDLSRLVSPAPGRLSFAVVLGLRFHHPV